MTTEHDPQKRDIEYNRVYRRAEYATRPEPWGSPLPSLEIIGDGEVLIYGSNLPRQSGENIYLPPIENTLTDIQAKMTLITPEKCPLKKGFHDACMCTVWIAFVYVEGSSTTPPILREACLLDWELDYRIRTQC